MQEKLLPFAQYVKLNVEELGKANTANIVRTLYSKPVRLVAEKLNHKRYLIGAKI